MGRRDFWREATSIIKDFPILGIGLNTYSKIAPRYKVSWGGYPHNCYLHMAAETGLLGLGSFIWMICVLFHMTLRNLKKIQNPFKHTLLYGFLLGLAGFLTHSFLDTNFYSIQLGMLFWLAISVIMQAQIPSD